MTKPASPRRAELFLTTALVALIAAPAAGQIIHPLPVLENSSGAAGGANVASLSANTMLIGLPDSQPRTIIRWDSFDVGAGSSVSISGIYAGTARPQLAVLNRVTGTDSSEILGNLTSEQNIAVFLINSNGILFGSGTHVDVGSFFASTLNIVDPDFLSNTLLFEGTPTNPNAAVSTGITLQNGAQVQSTAGPLVLIGGFVNTGANSTVSGGAIFTPVAGVPQDVALLATNSVTVTVPANPGSPLSYTTHRATPITSGNGINVAGRVNGRNVNITMETLASAQNALLLIDDTALITATPAGGGDIVIDAAARQTDGSFTYLPGSIQNDGTLNATGDVLISGRQSGNSGAIFRPLLVVNNGSITAGGNATLRSHQTLTNNGTISGGSGVELLAETGNITNSNLITAFRDVTATSGGSMFLSGTTQGRDVALNAGGSVDANVINARDDIAIKAVGAVTTSSLTSGATVGGIAPVDTFAAADNLAGSTLSGHDIDIKGRSITASDLAALGIGSDIHLWTGVSAPEQFDIETSSYFLDDLDFFAGGNIQIDGAAQGGDITMVAGGNLNVQNVSALDDIVLEATGQLRPGVVSSGQFIFGFSPVDAFGSADAEEDTTLVGHDIILSSPDMQLSSVTASGTDSDITMQGGATAAVAGGDLNFTAGGRIDNAAVILTSGDVALSAGTDILDSSAGRTGSISGRDIALSAGGSVSVGTLTARDDVVIRAAGGPVEADTLTAGATINGNGPVDVFGSADSLLDTTLAGHDVDIDGIRISAGNISALGAGSDILIRKPLSAPFTDSDGVLIALGSLNLAAGGGITINGAVQGSDVALNAGGALVAGNINARDDIAIQAGGSLTVGTLSSGVSVAGLAPTEVAGPADALLGRSLPGHDLSVAAPTLNLSSTLASGQGSDLFLTATTGDLTVRNLTVGGNASLDALRSVTVGPLNASAGTVSILADNVDIVGNLTGAQVTITNRAGGNAVTALGDATTSGNSTPNPATFTLTAAELNRITTPVLTIDSLGQNLLIGNLALNGAAGSTRVNLLGTARVDLIGQLSASGSGRTVQLGGNIGSADPTSIGTLASIIRIAPTSSAGGRIVVDGGTLDLRGAKIGVGLDDGFLTPLGLLAGGTPLSTSIVAKDWIANRKSTLYGVPGGYSNPTIISAGTLRVTYADYALFQNTAAPSASMPTGVNAGTLEISSSGTAGQNGFALFGTIRDVNGAAAALVVKPDDVSLVNSRVNGCLIVTGGGCGAGGSSDLPIPFNVIESAEAGASEAAAQGVGSNALATQKLVSTDEERTFDFESLVGTNNEGLLGAISTEVPPATDQCTPQREGETCPTGEKPNEQ